MKRMIFPAILSIAGLAGGVGAGQYLRPSAAASPDAAHGEAMPTEGEPAAVAGEHGEAVEGQPEFVKLSNQFVVPVVTDGRVSAMVVLSLTIEVTAGTTEATYAREPKLRDAFLQVLFDHANSGGFTGSFTDGSNLIVLRRNLKEAAVLVLGPSVSDVLITDIARQDS